MAEEYENSPGLEAFDATAALSEYGEEGSLELPQISQILACWQQDLASGKSAVASLEACRSAIEGASRLAAELLRHLDGSDWSPELFEACLQLSQRFASIHGQLSQGALQQVMRVTAGWGWALHGLAFELHDGTRVGQFLENNGAVMDLLGDAALRRRGARWQNLREGERILQVRGHNCRGGYLAYDIELVTNCDRTIHFSAEHPEWRGTRFEWTAPPGHEIVQVHLAGGNFRGCTSACYLPFSSEDREEVRTQLRTAAEVVVLALVRASIPQGAKEAKYALFQAEGYGIESAESLAEHLREVPHAALGELELPGYWDMSVMRTHEVHSDSGLTFDPSDNINLVGKVPLSGDELQVMQELFDASFRKRYTRDRKGGKVPDRLEVERGFRVQNAMNWAEYRARVEIIASQLAELKNSGEPAFDHVEDLKTGGHLPDTPQYELDGPSNSAFLFHGTNDAAAEAITSADFRIDKAGTNAGTLFGQGVYLAESCSKSDEYSCENEDGLRCMLVCRAALGNILYCDERRPDIDGLVRSCVQGKYHSVLGDREKIHSTFREFIVYDDDQVYPEYIIWYRRVYS